MADVVLYEKRGRIAYITMNRPEVMNAQNSEVWQKLVDAWIQVRDDPEVWSAIVTGAGDKAFSAGADLRESAELAAQAEREGCPFQAPSSITTLLRGIEMWKPTIAAINGFAACITSPIR